MSSLSESITILKSQLESAEKEIQALQLGKKASSSRARKSLMSVKTGSHDLRKQIMGFAKSLPTKSRIKKKTEEKDKYWLRAFRAYMKSAYSALKFGFSAQDQEFWESYLSHSGKPEKGRSYSSYGRRYKAYLFSHYTFAQNFRIWFREYAGQCLKKKYTPGSALWTVYYNYATEELLTLVRAPDTEISSHFSVASTHDEESYDLDQLLSSSI